MPTAPSRQRSARSLLSFDPATRSSARSSAPTATTTGRRWVIDPIDATKNFVRGVPVWATLIALDGRRRGRRRSSKCARARSSVVGRARSRQLDVAARRPIRAATRSPPSRPCGRVAVVLRPLRLGPASERLPATRRVGVAHSCVRRLLVAPAGRRGCSRRLDRTRSVDLGRRRARRHRRGSRRPRHRSRRAAEPVRRRASCAATGTCTTALPRLPAAVSDGRSTRRGLARGRKAPVLAGPRRSTMRASRGAPWRLQCAFRTG